MARYLLDSRMGTNMPPAYKKADVVLTIWQQNVNKQEQQEMIVIP